MSMTPSIEALSKCAREDNFVMPRYLILFHRLSKTTKSVSTINTQFSFAIMGSKLNTSFLVSRWFRPRLFKYSAFHKFPGVFSPRHFLEGYE